MSERHALYWATVLTACSIGETVADLVSHELGFGYVCASLLFGATFAGIALLGRWIRIGLATRYWTAIALMSTTGTALADLFTRTLRLGYTGTSVVLGVLFCGVLVGWSGVTDRAAGETALAAADLPETDAGYWAAIMLASTLGTSLGDFVSNVVNAGFGGGTLLLGAVLAVVLVTDHLAARPSTARYWAALVTTSTIGATSGDYLTKADGLGLPFAEVIALQIAVFVTLVALSRSRRWNASNSPRRALPIGSR